MKTLGCVRCPLFCLQRLVVKLSKLIRKGQLDKEDKEYTEALESHI